MADISEFIQKVKNSIKDNGVDLSSGEDLSIAVMNLISLEEHLFFTFEKTHKKEYLKFLNEVRETRKELLAKIVKESEGEIWCISKHLLAVSMRLIEVGTKYLKDGKNNEAENIFEKAYALYSMFWAINLKIIKSDKIKNELKQIVAPASSERDGDDKKSKEFTEILNKLMDCCDE